MEAMPVPMKTRDREALGLPRRFQPSGVDWTLRAQGLPEQASRLLVEAVRRSQGETLLSGPRGSRTVLASIPRRSWTSFRGCLAAERGPLSVVADQIDLAFRPLCRPHPRIRLARRSLPLGGRTLIVGILNVTPDSFFDHGRWSEPARAVERAFRMVEEGADVVDIGGESTRPGSRSISAREELRRVLPVIERLAGRLPVPLSIDTTKSEVAEVALRAGVEIVNDISGLSFDGRMARVAARHGAGIFVSHIRGRPRRMQANPQYRHLIPEVLAFLRRGIGRAVDAGVNRESILIDPGIGFGKTADHNLLLLRHLRLLLSSGHPILVGASRKSFLGKILGRNTGGRLEGSLAAAVLAVVNGAAALRVHDVAETLRAARAAEALRDAGTRKHR